MKKNPIIFIAMLVALAFTSCQMNTDETEYAITIDAPHGTVELDKTKAKAGEVVKVLGITANDGYKFETMSIKKDNGEDVTGLDRTNKSFTMPESNVTVTVNFEKKDTPTETTPTDDNGGEEVDEPADDNGNEETEDIVDEADSEPVDETPTESPTTEATSYKVVYGELELKAGLTLAQVNAYITQIPLVETTDYSIDKVKGEVTLTDSGYNKLNNYFATNGEPTTTEPTDTTNDGVVYAACKITLPNIDPETGEIVVTNKGKDGNSVVEKVYKDNTGVYLGADEGDIIEIQLRPDETDVWDAYKYFEYENELTVKNAFGEKLTLTKVGTYTYTFTMPKTYVKVELPYGFEKLYSLTLDKPTNTKAEIFYSYGEFEGTKEPGKEVYVMVVGNEVPRIEGLKRDGVYKYDDITFKNITDEVLATRKVSGIDGSTRVKIGDKSYTMAYGDSWDSTGVHFYSFIMPRDSITIKLTGN